MLLGKAVGFACSSGVGSCLNVCNKERQCTIFALGGFRWPGAAEWQDRCVGRAKFDKIFTKSVTSGVPILTNYHFPSAHSIMTPLTISKMAKVLVRAGLLSDFIRSVANQAARQAPTAANKTIFQSIMSATRE